MKNILKTLFVFIAITLIQIHADEVDNTQFKAITPQNIHELTEINKIEHERVEFAQWTYDGKYLLVLDEVGLWRYSYLEFTNPLLLTQIERSYQLPITYVDVMVSYDSLHVAVQVDNHLSLWDVEARLELWNLTDRRLKLLALSKMTFYAAGSHSMNNRTFNVYDTMTASLLNTTDVVIRFGEEHPELYVDLYHNRLVVFLVDDVHIVDLDMMEKSHVLDLPSFTDTEHIPNEPLDHIHIGFVEKVVTSLDENIFYVLFWNENGMAGFDHEVYFSVVKFDLLNNDANVTLSQINGGNRGYGYIEDISVNLDGDIIAYSLASSVRFLDTNNEVQKRLNYCMDETQCLGGFSYRIYDVAFHPENTMVATVSSDEFLRLWGIPSDS